MVCRKRYALSLNPKFNYRPVNEQIAQGMIFLIFHYAYFFIIILIGFKGNRRDNISGCSKNLELSETKVALGLGERPELRVNKNAVGLNEIFIENKSEEVQSKANRDESSLVSASFQTANGKKISISEESKRSVQNILREFQGNLQETYYETELKDIKAQMSIKSMHSKFGKNTNKTGFQAMCEKGKEEKINESPSTSKLSSGPMVCRKRYALSLHPKFNYRPPPQLCETSERTSRQIETTTSTPGVNRPKRGRLSDLSHTYTSSRRKK
ncbi:hypothetical protein GQX74_005361 [Glossina fuscipes]|nr:hypothetical protein GQX74_005361 [Glossina fuscipes]